MYKRPNLFIVGAPKCGTSALYTYLRSHPEIFMPVVKEPHYFCSDFPALRRFPTSNVYLSLFDAARPEHTIIGEATSRYLYSQQAIRSIRELEPQAKFIAMLRNPVDLAHSLHGQLLYQFWEDEPDFERAWNLQAARRIGQYVPSSCPAATELLYGEVAQLGNQVQRLFKQVPRRQICLIFYDDFRADTAAVYQKVLRFLGVATDNRRDFPAVNAHKGYHWQQLARVLVDPPFPLSTVKSGLKRTFGWQETSFGRWVYGRLTKPQQREPMSPALRSQLVDFFYDDIRLLERLTGNDLSSWYSMHTSCRTNQEAA